MGEGGVREALIGGGDGDGDGDGREVTGAGLAVLKAQGYGATTDHFTAYVPSCTNDLLMH